MNAPNVGGLINVACIGDSITYAPSMPSIGVSRSWVDQLTAALERRAGPRAGDGFRGLWRDTEWSASGTWTETQPTDAFDVAPFHRGLFSAGTEADELTWSKPPDLHVDAFDLYWFTVPSIGRWQYRVDDGAWTNVPAPTAQSRTLSRLRVDGRVERGVSVRGHDGNAPCVASLAGISTYTSRRPRVGSVVVHNLGYQQQSLAQFCRPSEGNPLALLDELRPRLVTVLFSNDVRFRDPDRFARALQRLLRCVEPYGVAVVMIPFEQRTPRCVDDAITVAGSTTLTSTRALFLPTDVSAPLLGTHIARGASITKVLSPETVTMTAPATGSSNASRLVISGRRDVHAQATYRAFAKATAETFGSPIIDLYDAFSQHAGGGWDAAYAAGLMYDALHPTQAGHDLIAKCVIDTVEPLWNVRAEVHA